MEISRWFRVPVSVDSEDSIVAAGEFHIADGDCQCSDGLSVLIDDVPQHERRAFKLIRSRNETINGRSKNGKS